MPVVLITGGTGLIGTHLTQMLAEKGYDVIILSRQFSYTDHKLNDIFKNVKNKGATVEFAYWNIGKGEINKEAIAKADYIIHLAGANLAEKRWTGKRKKEIVESRTKSTLLLVKILKETENKVKVIISTSAIGWYGGDTIESKKSGFTEDAPANKNFLGETCSLWEESIQPVKQQGKRLVILRTGIVLSNDEGALIEFKKPLRFGIAAILGNGRQVTSWIHIDDLCRIYIYAIENNINGVFNAVAPQQVTNKKLMLSLAKLLRGKYFIPLYVPSFLLKLVIGEMSIEVLKSATVSAEKIKSAGFQFLFPSIDAALNELYRKG